MAREQSDWQLPPLEAVPLLAQTLARIFAPSSSTLPNVPIGSTTVLAAPRSLSDRPRGRPK